MMESMEEQSKEAYEPPEIRKVKLVRGELAVAVCKSSSSKTGPTTGCFRSNCKNVGS
jgi:hypothetical protein